MSEELLNICPRWGVPCMREDCVSYAVNTKQRFKNIKTGNYVPLDQISFYADLPQEEIDVTINRTATIVRECKFYGKIIEITEVVDHKVPSGN